MAKLVLLFLIGFVVYCLIRSYVAWLSKQEDRRQIGAPEDMVRCSYCGVHLPRSESILANDKLYCCEEHRRVGGSSDT